VRSAYVDWQVGTGFTAASAFDKQGRGGLRRVQAGRERGERPRPCRRLRPGSLTRSIGSRSLAPRSMRCGPVLAGPIAQARPPKQ